MAKIRMATKQIKAVNEPIGFDLKCCKMKYIAYSTVTDVDNPDKGLLI
jgi:hypothetical protein